jgi:hypothetical protein
LVDFDAVAMAVAFPVHGEGAGAFTAGEFRIVECDVVFAAGVGGARYITMREDDGVIVVEALFDVAQQTVFPCAGRADDVEQAAVAFVSSFVARDADLPTAVATVSVNLRVWPGSTIAAR